MNKYIKIWILLLLSPIMVLILSYFDIWNDVLEFFGIMSIFVWIPLWLISIGFWISYSYSKDKSHGLVIQPTYKENELLQSRIFIWLPIMMGIWLYLLFSPSLSLIIKPADIIFIKSFFIGIPLLIIFAITYSYVKDRKGKLLKKRAYDIGIFLWILWLFWLYDKFSTIPLYYFLIIFFCLWLFWLVLFILSIFYTTKEIEEYLIEPSLKNTNQITDSNGVSSSNNNDLLEIEKEFFDEILKEWNLQEYQEYLAETKELYTDWIKDEQSEKRKEEIKVVLNYIDEEYKKYNLV
ncbi:MAG: hypothetical protein ACD_71C00128G0002 [uncultured bacterium (gcode 4)]|uniref:Uncharacterized protein n=1 Tax=uncultured bacterium (gcode 4) TaxID=1234023 RepID=K2A364_9BACT|nr:MAG: hypothetical protein ACD_71C00128G0002 [uncultured bacterium (gcode 4)]